MISGPARTGRGTEPTLPDPGKGLKAHRSSFWSRTTEVDTNGVAAKNIIFDSLGEKGTPLHVREHTSRLTGITPKNPLSTIKQQCSDRISADPSCPFPKSIISVCIITSISYRYVCMIVVLLV